MSISNAVGFRSDRGPILIALMLLGRLGPITLGAALALRSTPRHYQYPEERVLVG